MGGQPYRNGKMIMGDARSAEGQLLCECGWASPDLPTEATRRYAHDEHKARIRDGLPQLGSGIVGRCYWCREAFVVERDMTEHYDMIRASAGCHPPEVRL